MQGCRFQSQLFAGDVGHRYHWFFGVKARRVNQSLSPNSRVEKGNEKIAGGPAHGLQEGPLLALSTSTMSHAYYFCSAQESEFKRQSGDLDMEIPLSVLGLAVLLVWLIYKSVVIPLFVSPLAKLPTAHPSCAVSSRWFQQQCAQMRELKTLYAAHEKHGPIVRLAPDQVSVVSEEGIRHIYVAGLDKSVWYRQTFYNYGVQNLVSTLDHKTHSRVRRMIAGLYTKSYLHRSPDMDQLSRRIIFGRFLPKLKYYGQHRQNVEVMKLFEWTGVDFITGYIFGTASSTDFLQDEASRDRYFGEWDKARGSPDLKEKPITEGLYMNMCKTAISSPRDSETRNGTQPLVISKMYDEISSMAKEWNMSEGEIMARCASEMVDHVIATQETNTITWTYILYRLSLHPELQHQLRSELRTLQPIAVLDNSNKTLPSPADIDSLPLLNAIVHETLRLHAANPARMQRVVPAAGLDLHGYYIPAGTTISTNAYCLHRNKEVFPEPFQWVPKRWIPTNGDNAEKNHGTGSDDMRRWFWAFGSGPRMCIGQNFAMQVIKLVVVAVYTQYTTSIVDDEGIEQSDSYNSGPTSHRLILRFHPADESNSDDLGRAGGQGGSYVCSGTGPTFRGE